MRKVVKKVITIPTVRMNKNNIKGKKRRGCSANSTEGISNTQNSDGRKHQILPSEESPIHKFSHIKSKPKEYKPIPSSKQSNRNVMHKNKKDESKRKVIISKFSK